MSSPKRWRPGRRFLSEPQAKALLAAYGIPIVEAHVVSDEVAAAQAAAQIGFPVVLKILSPDISHKSDVGGVALDLQTAQEVTLAALGGDLVSHTRVSRLLAVQTARRLPRPRGDRSPFLDSQRTPFYLSK